MQKKREVHCTGSNYNPTSQKFKIVKKDQSMSLAMLQGYSKQGDNYQKLDVKALKYCKIIW